MLTAYWYYFCFDQVFILPSCLAASCSIRLDSLQLRSKIWYAAQFFVVTFFFSTSLHWLRNRYKGINLCACFPGLISQFITNTHTLGHGLYSSISMTMTMSFNSIYVPQNSSASCTMAMAHASYSHTGSKTILKYRVLYLHVQLCSLMNCSAAHLHKLRYSLWFMDCKHLAAEDSTCSLYPWSWNFLV